MPELIDTPVTMADFPEVIPAARSLFLAVVGAGGVEGLVRIEDALQLLEKSFRYRRDFNPADYYKYSTGIMDGARPEEKVVAEVTGPIARLLRINPLHQSQQVVKEDAESIRIEMEVSVTEELIRQLLSFSNNMKIIKPAALRKRLAEELQRALDLNGK